MISSPDRVKVWFVLAAFSLGLDETLPKTTTMTTLDVNDDDDDDNNNDGRRYSQNLLTNTTCRDR